MVTKETSLGTGDNFSMRDWRCRSPSALLADQLVSLMCVSNQKLMQYVQIYDRSRLSSLDVLSALSPSLRRGSSRASEHSEYSVSRQVFRAADFEPGYALLAEYSLNS